MVLHRNHGSTLPKIARGPPKIKGEWSIGPSDETQVHELLEWIKDLKIEKNIRSNCGDGLDAATDPTIAVSGKVWI